MSDITVTSPDSLAVEVTVEASTGVTVSVPTVSSISVTEKGPKGDTGEAGPQGIQGEQGIQGIQGETGPAGADGADGEGLIAGGSENEFLQKNSATDYDTKWSAYTLPAADGTDRQVLMTDGAGTVSFAYPQTIAENVKNVSGGPLPKGTPVHVTGSVGNLAEVIAADAATNYPAHFVLDEDLADEGEGKGIALGFINNVDVPDASIYTEGQTVYLGASGGWTTTKPTGTNAIQNLGIIIKVNTGGNKISGVIMGAGRANDVPNIPDGQAWIGNASGVATPTTLADVATSGAYSDLSGTPSIPVSGVDFDPVGTDNSTDVTLAGAYNYLTLAGQEITLGQVDYTTDVSNTPSIPTSGVDFDPVGTDNSTDVTLSGPYNYLTLAGQQITLGQVDYTTDISNTPSIPVSGVDFDPVGTDNSTDVTLAGAYNYLTLAGQQITLGQVDYTTDISNAPTIPTSGVDFDPVGTDNSTNVTINANAQDVLSIASGQVLGSQDAGADKLVFWDDSAGKLTYADIGTNLTMTGTTLSASGGGGGGGGGGSAGGNFMITGFTSSTTQQWYGLYLPYANSIRTSGNWQHYQIYHMPADGSFDNFSMHVQGNCQIEFGINVNPQTAPNDQADGTQYNYKQLSPTGSNHTSYYSPTNWTFSAGDEIGFGFRNVSGGAPFYVTFNVCFTFN